MLAEHAAKAPGQVALRVVTVAGVDWGPQLEALRRRGVELEVLRPDDPASNLDDLRHSEAAHGEDAARRTAWRRLAAFDDETKALRALLPRLQQLGPGNGDPQDPRLQDVARIAAAEASFWDSVLGEPALAITPDEATALLPAPAAGLAPGRIDDASLVAAAKNEARLCLGPRRWIVARTAWDHVRTQCRAVAAHATTVAARTRDAEIAARYRALAARCDGIARELDGVLTP